MRKLLLIILVFTAMSSCIAQKTNKMNKIKTFNYAYYKSKLRDKTTTVVYTETNGDIIKVSFDKDTYSVVTIRPTTFMGYTEIYYKNSILKKEGGWLFCSNVKIGIWKEYDEEGNQVQENNENEKFNKLRVNPKDLLQWMERQGWIDLRTGKGEQTDFSNPPFQISFTHHKGSHAKWYVSRVTKSGTEDFVIDAETGDIISHENVLNIE